MKLNNNNNQITFINVISLLFTILICFALDKCAAHSFTDTVPNIETKSTSNQAYPPKASNNENPFFFPPSEAPEAQTPTSGDNFGHSSSFSGAFSDILKGSINDPSITMPPQGNSDTKYNKNNVLEQICSHTHYPHICIVTIRPLLNHNVKIDTKIVLQVAIKASVHQVKLTKQKVKRHAARSPELDDALADCKEKYHNTLKNLKSAIDCIPSNDFGKLHAMLSTVMADVSTCESKFEDLTSSSSSMSKTHGLVSIMVNNCLSIASLLHH